MKKNILASYFAGITDTQEAEKYSKLIRYFIPEYITTLIIYAFPLFLDSVFIGSLKSTPTYAALGIGNNFIHFIQKIAEAFSIAAVILVGYHNGRQEHQEAGKVLRDTFWLTVGIGVIFSSLVYFGAYWIYVGLGTPADIIVPGIPYLRIRAIGFMFLFLCLAFLGFLRGVKNTRATMYVYAIGISFFIFFDYCLIFGHCGFPALGLNGSALAYVIQNAVMFLVAVGIFYLDPAYTSYRISLFSGFSQPGYIMQLLTMAWPIAIDKGLLAGAYLWLNKMINPMGTATAASFVALKDMERIAFLPALAFAQIITFLVSNDYGARQWQRIKSNIKRVIFISSILVGFILLTFSIFSLQVLSLFDRCGDFTHMTARIFPLLSILVLFDIVQLILAGALRGAGNVKVVMWVRAIIIIGYFIPVSYWLSQSSIASSSLKFLLIYSSFYIGNALMSIVYIKRFRSEAWKHQISSK